MNKKRILAISDIHGNYNQLIKLLDEVNYNHETDQLVICGDLCDRGYNNVNTIMYARDLKSQGAVILLGNHDKMAYLSIQELIDGDYGINCQMHVNCINGYETVSEFENLDIINKKIIRDFLKDLPMYYEYEKYIFVHSGVASSLPINKNSEDTLLWSREEFYWNEAYEDMIVIFGHTPTKYLHEFSNQSTIWFDNYHKDKIGIDCGCFFTGVLGCLEIDLESGKYSEYYVRKEDER